MRKPAIITLLMVIIFVFLVPAIISIGIRYIPFGIQPPFSRTEKIYSNISVNQGFVSKEDNFTGVGLSLKNPNLGNDQDITLSILEDGTVLRQSVLSGAGIADGGFVKFIFEPIKHSKDEVYSFTLSAPSAEKASSLEVFYTPAKPKWAKELMVNEKTVNEAVSFVTLHKPKSKLILFNRIYSGWIDRLIQDRPFFILYSVLIIAILSNLLYLIRKEI